MCLFVGVPVGSSFWINKMMLVNRASICLESGDLPGPVHKRCFVQCLHHGTFGNHHPIQKSENGKFELHQRQAGKLAPHSFVEGVASTWQSSPQIFEDRTLAVKPRQIKCLLRETRIHPKKYIPIKDLNYRGVPSKPITFEEFGTNISFHD